MTEHATRSARAVAALGALALWGCAALLPAPATGAGSGAPGATSADDGAVVQEPDALKTPPPPGLAELATFPAVERRELGNGFGISYLRQQNLPLARIVVTFRSGRAHEGDHVGVARVTAQLMKLGGAGALSGKQMIDRLESFGSSLEVTTGSDHTSFTLSVLNPDLAPALAALGQVLGEARMPLAEFLRVKQAEIERTGERARGDFQWGNQLVLFRQLFEAPTGVHPYAHFDAKASDLERLQLADCSAWRLRHLVPANAELAVVGSLEPASVFEAAEKAFQRWQGAAAPAPSSFDRPAGPARLEIHVIDRAESPLSLVTAGVLGAPRKSAAWPALALSTYILGSGPASRLFLDLHEEHQWALEIDSDLLPLRDAPSVVQVQATALSADTVPVVKSITRELARLASEAPSTDEVEHAARSLTRAFLNHPNPLKSLSEMLATQIEFGLEPSDYDGFHQTVLELDPASIQRVVRPYFDADQTVVVVSADAKAVAKPLAQLAPVIVLDPERDFSIRERLPYSPIPSP